MMAHRAFTLVGHTWWRSSAALMVLLAASLLFETVPNARGGLARTGSPSRRLEAAMLALRRPGGGEEVLPARVRMAIEVLRARSATDFTYSAGVRADNELFQRLIEGAFPIRAAPRSSFVVSTAGEALPAACTSIHEREGVVVATCAP